MKNKRPFLYGFLVLAMVMLLSGFVQSNAAVEKSSDVYTLVQPPGDAPAINLVSAMFPSPVDVTSKWYCTLNPGYVIVTSEVISRCLLKAITTDVRSTKHISLSKLNKRYYAQLVPGYKTQGDSYRRARDRLRYRLQA